MKEDSSDIFANAFWIWLKQEKDPVNQYVCIRHSFQNPQTDETAELHISADTDFIAYVNGQEAGRFQFPDYPEQKTYSTFDIGKMLRKGNNTISVLAYHCGENFSTYRKGSPGLIASIISNNKCLAASDKRWKCIEAPFFRSGMVPKTTNQLGFTICADGRKLDKNWMTAEYDDTEWQTAEEDFEAKRALLRRPLPPLIYEEKLPVNLIMQGFLKRSETNAMDSFAKISSHDTLLFRPPLEVFEKESIGLPEKYEWPENYITLKEKNSLEPVLKALADTENFNGYFAVFDMNEFHAGMIELSVTAGADTVLDVSYGEHLDDGRVRCNVGGRNFTDRYICAEGRNDFSFPFKRASGRYIEVHMTETGSKRITIHYIGMRPVKCATTEQREFFRCSDRLTEKLHEAAVRTLELCMHDHYEDCPWREQALYSYDSRNQALYGYYLWGNYKFAETSIDLLGRGLRENGFLELCAPAKVHPVIPIFSFVWVAELYEYYLHSGKLELFEKYSSQIKAMTAKALSGYEEKTGLYITDNEDCLWHFYEWTRGIDGIKKPADGFILQAGYNIYLYEMLTAFIKLLLASDDKSQAQTLSEIAEKLKTAINKVFWKEKEGIYSAWINPDSSQEGAYEHIQAIALFNALPDSRRKKAVIGSITGDRLEKISLSSMCYMLRAFMETNEQTRLWISRRMAEMFEPIVLKGYSALWETAKGSNDFSGAGSLCHGWSSLPAYYCNSYVLGVQPLEAGFRKFRIAPFPDRLYNAKGKIATPYGDIEVEWERISETRIIYTARGPEELEAVLAPYPETEISAATYNKIPLCQV